MTIRESVSLLTACMDETEKIIIGKREQISLMMVSLLAGGHVLLDDLPGSGKTTLVKTLSRVLGCDFRRIQFTPDLLPSDILGMNIFNQKTGDFQFREGPVKTNILLADEINRAIPRTQAALLEAMEERQVTIDGETHPLPEPFLVMATQNPVENESTFRLPAAQMDRFFVKLSLGYPTEAEEVEMISRLGDGIPFEQVRPVLDPEKIRELQQTVSRVHVSEDVKSYLVALVHRTRSSSFCRSGASPRASRSLYQGCRAQALLCGRDFVIPEDVQKLAVPVLAHRLVLSGEARLSGHTAEEAVRSILREEPVPPFKEDLFHGQ